MYSDKLVVALKSQNKILREFKDTVYCPFGSEYSVFVKNLNTVRALVSVFIDGTDIAEGTSFIVQPGESIDLERFVKNGNMDSGNKFKFIERTANIENHRGITAEDGLIRVEFKFERRNNSAMSNPVNGSRVLYSGGVQGSLNGDYRSKSIASLGSVAMTYLSDIAPQCSITATSVNDVGITAPGSVSEQQFTRGQYFPTESMVYNIVLKIVGELDQKPVAVPVTVKSKPRCESCGKVNKAASKFCSECGTSLTIV
jgi:hypothetical protein